MYDVCDINKVQISLLLITSKFMYYNTNLISKFKV
jgi:hypothetical protein